MFWDNMFWDNMFWDNMFWAQYVFVKYVFANMFLANMFWVICFSTTPNVDTLNWLTIFESYSNFFVRLRYVKY